MPRQRIPAGALFHEVDPDNPVPGVRVDYFEGDWDRLPDFSRLTPLRSGMATNLEILEPNRGYNFGLRFTGSLRIPSAGDYRFFVASDDGSRLTFEERCWQISTRGAGAPLVPRQIAPGQPLQQVDDHCWSEVRGEVGFVGVTEDLCAFDLFSSASRMQVEVNAGGRPWAQLLGNSRVRVQGVCRGSRSPGSTLLATDLLVPSPDQVWIERLPTETWRRYPPTSIASVWLPGASQEVLHWVGVVRGVEDGRKLTLEDDTGSLQVLAPHARLDWMGAPLEVLALPQGLGSNKVWVAAALRLLPATATEMSAITPIETIRMMHPEEFEQEPRVRIRGAVISDWSSFSVTVHDGDYGISCWFDDPVLTPAMGDYVEVEGNVRAGAFGPNLGSARMTVLGRASLPTPLIPTWDRLINGSLDQQWVEVEGVVQGVEDRTLSIGMVGGNMEVELVHGDPDEIARLQDALVRVRGSVLPIYNPQRQIEGVKLRVSSPLFVQVEQAANPDPFTVPAKSVEELTRFDPAGANPFYRVKVRGQVIYAHRTECHLVDGLKGIRFLPKEGAQVVPGDWVEVVGYPRLGGKVPLLREALVRTTGHGDLPVPAQVRPDEFFGGNYESTRVRMDALLVNVSQVQSEKAMELQFGGRWVTARLRGPQAFLFDVPVGSRVRVVGTCAGRGLHDELGNVDTSELLVNNAADVVLLERPPWWTTRRIMILAGVLAGVLAVSLAWIHLLRRRVEQRTAELNREMRQRKEAELQRASEQERSRIARDLHDDLGSSLTEISLLAGLGMSHADREAANERFGVIAGKARSLVNSLDAIVWAADPEEDQMEAFADYLAANARVFLESSGIVCRFKVPIELPGIKLDGRVRHDLFLAVKETLNNIVRHAGASEVEFGMNLTDHTLEIAIADNGRGFDPQHVARGNGLANLESRLAGIGGTCAIESSPGKGTKVRMKLDLRPSA